MDYVPIEAVNRNLNKKYNHMNKTTHLSIINSIIFNDRTGLVALFKDYLISDDLNDFFKQYYLIDDIKVRFVRILSFYSRFSKVFPNYFIFFYQK